MNAAIQNILNQPYGANLQGQTRNYVCWKFCQDMYRLLDCPPLCHLQHQSGLKRIAVPIVPCIVLFHMAGDWHSGVVYPDTLHFIHAAPLTPDRKTTAYVVCRERLTGWPYNLMIEGYYAP